MFFQEPSGMAALGACNLFRRAFGDDEAPITTGFRAHFEHMICGGNNVQVVLDDQDGVAAVEQSLQHCDQLLHIIGMQTCRRFVEHVDRVAARAAR